MPLQPSRPALLKLLMGGCVSWGLTGCQDYAFEKLDTVFSSDDESNSVGHDVPKGEHIVEWCEGAIELADSVGDDETCLHIDGIGDLEAVVEWSRASFIGGYNEYNVVVMAPMVGQLTDDDGDGDIDRDDHPDIVLVSDDAGAQANPKGVLRILQGHDGTELLTVYQSDFDGLQVSPYRYTNVALGDVDVDGQPEIVLVAQVTGSGGGDDGGDDGGGPPDTAPPDSGAPPDTAPPDEPVDTDNPIDPEPPNEIGGDGVCTLAAFSPDGTVEWVATELSIDCGGHAPAIADLEGDGTVEVIVGPHIVEGATGMLRTSGTAGQGRFAAYDELGYHSIVIDLEGDGIQELVAGPTLYEPDGTARCTAEGLAPDGFTAAADLDMDGQGEVVLVGNGEVGVYEADCTVSAGWTLPGHGSGGPPTIGDFDGVGVPEIGIAAADVYAVYEVDGSTLWTAPVADASSHATGSVVFDFEGDGKAEVVYADETRLWVFAGDDGRVRLESTLHASRTLHEYPTVADLDHDGSTEIILPQGGGHDNEGINGLVVLGSEDDSWTSSRQVWNQHAYSITNIEDDLSVPAPAPPNWPSHNTFRSGDLHPTSGGLSPDAVPLADVCLLECGAGRVVVSVALGNGGAGSLRAGVPISIYAGPEHAPTHLFTTWTDEIVVPGSTTTEVSIEVPLELLGDEILGVIVDDDGGAGYVPECSEENNVLWIDDPLCP